MVKLTKKFSAGDKVFAKVRGYPAWPARIEGVTDANTKNAKYNVYFYGTGETAVCKVEELFVYLDNKDKFTKPVKRKIFHDGIQALEKELKSDVGKAASLDDLKALASESASAAENAEKTGVALTTAVAAADSDMESGPLVIDEGDKKKPAKRKTAAVANNDPDTPETKKKRGRGRVSAVSVENTPKHETTGGGGGDSQGEESSPGKEVVSRSGRKIKPKRFADFSSSEETESTDKNENSTRSRGRGKTEDSNENRASPSIGRKKAVTAAENSSVDAAEEERKYLAVEKFLRQTDNKLSRLRTEAHLLQMDARIKSSLRLDEADVDDCLKVMDHTLALDLDPLMLKKHPHMVETVKRLRRYIGNLAEWKLSEEEEKIFKQKAEEIRQKAELIYNKFKAMFTIPEGQSFWQTFSEQVLHFRELTKHMPETKVLSLMVDPTRPGRVKPSRDSTSATTTATTKLTSATTTAATTTTPTTTTTTMTMTTTITTNDESTQGENNVAPTAEVADAPNQRSSTPAETTAK